MNRKPAPLLLFLLLLPGWAFSQLVFPENFKLGDTSQVHRITTERGDLFIGTVTAWTGDSLYFRLKNGTKLSLPAEAVRSLETSEGRRHIVLASDKITPFLLQPTGDNPALTGKLIKLGRRKVSFKSLEEGYDSFKYEEIASITPGPGWGIDHNHEYRVIFPIRKDEEGLLLGLTNEEVGLLQNGVEHWFDRADIMDLKPSRYRLPVGGHERSLLFSPTGFNMRGGQKEFRSLMVLHNSFAFGINDHLSFSLGAYFIVPFVQMKASFDVGKYIHLSAGGLCIPMINSGNIGWHLAASIGTPDGFVNITRFKNIGNLFDPENDLKATALGGSVRVGNRKRLIAEIMFVDSQLGELFNLPDEFVSLYSFGMGIFPENISLTFGLGLVGPTYPSRSSIFGNDDRTSHQLYPFFAANISFGK